jgi:hypothetical protein
MTRRLIRTIAVLLAILLFAGMFGGYFRDPWSETVVIVALLLTVWYLVPTQHGTHP